MRDLSFSPDTGEVGRLVYDEFGMPSLPLSFFDCFSIGMAGATQPERLGLVCLGAWGVGAVGLAGLGRLGRWAVNACAVVGGAAGSYIPTTARHVRMNQERACCGLAWADACGLSEGVGGCRPPCMAGRRLLLCLA